MFNIFDIPLNVNILLLKIYALCKDKNRSLRIKSISTLKPNNKILCSINIYIPGYTYTKGNQKFIRKGKTFLIQYSNIPDVNDPSIMYKGISLYEQTHDIKFLTSGKFNTSDNCADTIHKVVDRLKIILEDIKIVIL